MEGLIKWNQIYEKVGVPLRVGLSAAIPHANCSNVHWTFSFRANLKNKKAPTELCGKGQSCWTETRKQTIYFVISNFILPALVVLLLTTTMLLLGVLMSISSPGCNAMNSSLAMSLHARIVFPVFFAFFWSATFIMVTLAPLGVTISQADCISFGWQKTTKLLWQRN